MHTDLTVAVGETPKRLDRYLVTHERQVSRVRLQRLIRLGRVQVNGRPTKSSHVVRGGDRITVDVPPAAPLRESGATVSLEILYEDADLLVVNKPHSVPMHPGPGHWADSLWNAVRHHFEATSPREAITPGLIHRLDQATSGLVVIAKQRAAHKALSAQCAQHRFTRRYHAVIHGTPIEDHLTIDLPLGRDRSNRKKVSGQSAQLATAQTLVDVLCRHGDSTSVMLTPVTGRTHQLRAHLHHIGHPIVGDPLYRPMDVPMANPVTPAWRASRLMLHASVLGFHHPSTGQYQEFEVELPSEM